MRKFVRHPTEIPIVCRYGGTILTQQEGLVDVGQGGVCFRADFFVEPGSAVHMTLPIYRPAFEADGIVVWCGETNQCFEVGVKFSAADADFALRMVRHVCQIEHYRNEVLQRDGRRLTAEEAAAEWTGSQEGGSPRQA